MIIQIENAAQKKLQIVAKKYDLDFFILFGSRARGTAKKNSDYDLAYSKDLVLKQKKEFEKDISEILIDNEFDLIQIDNLTAPVLKMQIFKEGVCIYVKNKNLFERTKENSYFDFVDSQYLLEKTKEKFLVGEI